MEYLTLNNGVKMPMDGIGVFLFSPDEAESAVKSALKDGVRLIDTANAYMNNGAVGRAIKASGVREDIFLVTKLWPTVYTDANAIDESLARLDTDYVDLLFLHQPAGDWKAGYKLMEEGYKAARSRLWDCRKLPGRRSAVDPRQCGNHAADGTGRRRTRIIRRQNLRRPWMRTAWA